MSAPPSAPVGRRAAAVALYREAVPLKEIAARLGCSASGVNWLIGRAGVARVRKSVDDLTGLRSGSLVVVEMAGKDDGDGTLWLCRCDCGAARVVGRARLTTARSKATACVDCTEARGARGRRAR